MDIKLSLVLALAVTSLFPVLSIYTWQTRSAETYTEDMAVRIAIHYLKYAPTFQFDGILDSIKVESVETLRMPYTWEVTVAFQCRHSGYGDRTGMMLAQVITPHKIRVVVSEGRVMRAIIDDEWDEINQRDVVQSELLPPEYAKDLVIKYILENHPDLGAIPIPEVWAFDILTPEGLVGASIQQFIGDGWTVNVSFPVVARPVYKISILYSRDVSFKWKGTVDQSGNVEETSMSIKPEILLPEDARDLAVAYLIETKEELKDLKAPSSWTVKELTPPDLLGYSSKQFTSDGWTVNVSNPVVWKPTYEVEIEYTDEVSFHWKGTVDQDGAIEVLDYTKTK